MHLNSMITTQSKEIMITMTTITMIISTIIIKRIIILILILTMMTIVTITKGKETKLQLSSLIQMNKDRMFIVNRIT